VRECVNVDRGLRDDPTMTRSAEAPDGYHSINPYIVVEGVEELVGFLAEVFGGVERGEREIAPDGTIGHTEVQVGDSVLMLSEASSAYPPRPSVNFAYVTDVDSVFRAAISAGATAILEPVMQPWGDRIGGFHDPFDNRWWVATRVT
jgi:PhnB protein